MLRRLVLVVALVGLLGACSDDSGGDDGAASSSGETVPEVIANGVGSPEEASQRLVAAWADGDQDTATEVAGDDVIADLFALDHADDLSFSGCEGETDAFTCSFSGTQDVTFTVEGGAEGFLVTGVEAG